MNHSPASTPAARQWAQQLDAMALPAEILDHAPESPHGFDVDMFVRIADELSAHDTPSRRAALAALPNQGSVLDVGCGAGAAALQLVPPAALLFGVDEEAEMLGAFGERAEAHGVAHAEVVGRWPDVARRTPSADVVVCYHVLYNVPIAVPFLEALTAHARHRVVLELTAEHPLAWLRPYWRELHDYDRPPGPTADEAIALLSEVGYDVEVTRWEQPARSQRTPDEELAFVRQRLAVDTDRDPELRELLTRYPPPQLRSMVTLAWSP